MTVKNGERNNAGGLLLYKQVLSYSKTIASGYRLSQESSRDEKRLLFLEKGKQHSADR